MTDKKKCLQCGKPIPAKPWFRRFCGSYCRVKAWRKQQRKENLALSQLADKREKATNRWLEHDEFWKEE